LIAKALGQVENAHERVLLQTALPFNFAATTRG
jgi:hypothetical protein